MWRSAVCDEVFGFECKNKIDATLRMVLHQKDEGIDEYLGLDDYAVRCDGCEQGYYVTDLCTADPMFSDPKYMHHCADCPGLGKCIGDIRVRHCKKCDDHYFAGSNANLKCPCRSEGKSVSKASNDESDDECETDEDSESDSEEDSDMDEEAPSLADCILGLMKDFASKNQATIPTGPQAMTGDQVLEKLRRLGVENLDKVSGCVKAGIARGFIKLETASDLDKVIVAKTGNKILPTDCTHKVEATVKMVLHQKDWGGDEYNCIKNEHPVYCGKCGEGYFVSWICGGEPTLCYSKHMNHCKKCPDLGVCLGCCREDHCDRCGKHYFAGSMRDMPCDCDEVEETRKTVLRCLLENVNKTGKK
ncbi:uncharacterized protein LOC129597665 isoform X2 [Paramacrobiotus metropolitanus]|uniref:uncharacterized protein LOC129597665 isoform X2 n=1 Tax=Paramacrobiotus metropolitanus TaxID=2943436 RepID=UPI00244617FB|nr:uncharacterized protein LOC129597665 isoform X2 [Paramacrobiotus metropolitanus]